MLRIWKDKEEMARGAGKSGIPNNIGKEWPTQTQGKARQQDVTPGQMAVGSAVLSLYL